MHACLRAIVRVASLYCLCALLPAGGPVPALAAPPGTLPEPVELPAPPDGPPVLSIVGPDGERTYTRAQIEAFGLYRVRTQTFWPGDDGVYEGVPLARLLADAGLATASAVRVRGIDEFSQVVPREDWARWPLLLATRRDGRLLDVDSKGPLRLIYPRDSDPELAGPGYRLRWVWMIARIESVPAAADSRAP